MVVIPLFLLCFLSVGVQLATLPPGRAGSQDKPATLDGKNKDVPYATVSPNTDNGTSGMLENCTLFTVQENMFDEIKDLIGDEDPKLLEYRIKFPEYKQSPLKFEFSHSYKLNEWHRLFKRHGESLLNLVFDYETMSLTTLKFGTTRKKVELRDSPQYCFGKLTPAQMYSKIQKIVMHDFHVIQHTGDLVPNPKLWNEEECKVCHESIRNVSNKAEIGFQCCSWDESMTHIKCADVVPAGWARALNNLLTVVKALFWLFGPALLCSFVLSDNITSLNYYVSLSGWRTRYLHVQPHTEHNTSAVLVDQDGLDQYKDLKKRLGVHEKEEGSEEEVVRESTAGITGLYLTIDHDKLITETEVPAGLFTYLYRNFVACGISNYSPFFTCCFESIFGTWEGKFLRYNMAGTNTRFHRWNIAYRDKLSWYKCCRVIGWVFLLFLIPLPFYIRVWYFYNFEVQEIVDRREATEAAGLPWTYSPDTQITLLLYLGPEHGFYVTLYILYVVSAIVIFLIRNKDPRYFDNDTLECLQDLQNLSRVACVRLLVSHVLLPLEKCGLIGCLFNLIYMLVAIPVSVVVMLIYCFPTIYLTFRLFFPHRFKILQEKRKCKSKKTPVTTEATPYPSQNDGHHGARSNTNTHTAEEGAEKIQLVTPEEVAAEDGKPPPDKKTFLEETSVLESKKKNTLSKGMKDESNEYSLEEFLFLRDISPNKSAMDPKYEITKFVKNCFKKNCLVMGGMIFMEVLRRLMMVAWLYCFLFMYAECFVFIVHMMLLVLMGIVVNAGTVGKYAILGIYVVGYTFQCYGDVKRQYVELNRAIFDIVKAVNGEAIKEVALQPRNKQTHVAFNHYTEKQMANYYRTQQGLPPMGSADPGKMVLDVAECYLDQGTFHLNLSQTPVENTEDYSCIPADRIDHFDIINDQLIWECNNLVLFLDNDDTPRIPEKLFLALTQFEAPGCPGPIYKSLLRATRNLFYLIIFMAFVVVVITSFSSVYKVSSTNQMLATVAGGLLPVLIRMVLNPMASRNVDLTTYRFQGQMQEVLTKYEEVWPIHDIELEGDEPAPTTAATGPDGRTNTGPAYQVTFSPTSAASGKNRNEAKAKSVDPKRPSNDASAIMPYVDEMEAVITDSLCAERPVGCYPYEQEPDIQAYMAKNDDQTWDIWMQLTSRNCGHTHFTESL